MKALQFFFCCRFVRYQIFVRTAVEQRPEFTDKTVYTVDSVCIPWFGLFYRAEEHFVHTKCICTVFLNNHIWIDYIEHRFTHLFNCPSADIFSVFEDKFGCFIFRTPCFECFQIQNIIRYDIYVYVNRGNFVLIFQVQ